MGKTTNALEKVVEAFFAGNKEEALHLFLAIKQSHLNTLKYLCTLNWKKAEEQLNNFFTEIEWLLHDKPVREFDYYYDQVVCVGELLSTAIVSAYLDESGVPNQWLDVRDIFRTDNISGTQVLEFTQERVDKIVKPIFNEKSIVLQDSLDQLMRMKAQL
jgi:aspartate kinase